MPACRFGRFRLDPAGRRLTDEQGAVLPLAGRAFDVLEYLIRHRDRVVGKEELLAAVWPRLIVEENNLTQAVSAIRRALGDSRDTAEFVATVAGRGYRFVAALQPDLPQRPDEPLLPEHREPSPRPVAVAGRSRPPAYLLASALAMLLVAGVSVVGLQRASGPAAPTALVTLRPAGSRPTIAVLPFVAAPDQPASEVLAQSVTDLLRTRLAASSGAVVIGTPSTLSLDGAPLGVRDIGQKLRAQFLLRGSVGHRGDQLGIEAHLVDAASASDLWSVSFQPVTNVTAFTQTLARRVTGTLKIADQSPPADAPVNLEAYELYVQGQRMMPHLRADETEQAIELFRRSTILDPGFARGYLALGQAYLQVNRLHNIRDKGYLNLDPVQSSVRGPNGLSPQEVLVQARQALARALELDPGLGEAWVERASLEADPDKAEPLYRRGLRLAPNYGAGYMRFSQFLFVQYRKGEAIEMIDRAREIDPLTPELHVRKAFLLMVSRSDVEGHDRLLREALEINPRFHPALVELAISRHQFSGAFADGIRIVEQSIAVDPQAAYGRHSAASMYLDVDDPLAAIAVLGDEPQAADPMVEVAQFQRDRGRAAALARSRGAEQWDLGPIAPMAEAVRDDARATGDYASALKLLESQYAMGVPPGGGLRMWSRGLGIVYAHTLILAGQTERGRELASAILVQIDSESAGRTKDWFSRERAAVLVVLGEDEQALAALEASARTGKFYRWWYLAELDPLYEHLRGDPRFQALAEQAKQHRRSQRALLDDLRRKGEVPLRPS
jgi:DNA-binding winged helix-turn-helix (wHTH) protein/TolB-like protein/tetratricopeptide (TPR) repeat protein